MRRISLPSSDFARMPSSCASARSEKVMIFDSSATAVSASSRTGRPLRSAAAARVTGRGEHVDPIDLHLRGWHIALINPGIHISTVDAFGWIRPHDDRPGLDAWAGSGPENWSGGLANDFTAPAVDRHPAIGTALEVLRKKGATFADMSGSGSTVFGFFRGPLPQDWADALPSECRTWTGQFPD